MKQTIRNILFRIRSFNDLLYELSIFFSFVIRTLILMTVLMILKDHNIAYLHWFWKLVMMFYLFYPIYSHYFNKLFYMVIKE